MNSEAFRQRFTLLLPPDNAPVSPGGREAAVLVPVITYPEPHLLLTKRAAHLRHHPGQVAFPGGKRDPADRSLMQTALRETCEELGVPPVTSRLSVPSPSSAVRPAFASPRLWRC
ncbi:NUDIX hydrolase [Tatumella ptyseos]|uniref:Putative NUDIX hydrolase n=1 Tax=Tatumella ptyseos TaxID=82987 RepID=A0A2X5SID5_9GAMM|nr:NUDIX domain-containing protein [Tatumella ptyseos]SQK75154.1 putative NUDIX hydrolase [Tatumella ptyseos]